MKKYIKILAILCSITITSCVQEEHDKTITFYLDMNGIENVQSVGIRGNFLPNKWKKTVMMTDEDKDGIYEFSVSRKTASNGIEFKFVKNDTEFELEGKENRELVFEYKPEIIEYRTKFNNIMTVNIERK